MTIKSIKIHIFEDFEYQSYVDCCKFLEVCKIPFVFYSDTDDNNNRIWCIELESV